MRTRLFLALILGGISYTQSVNIRKVEDYRGEVSLDDDKAVDWADLNEEIPLAVNANNGVENYDGYEELEFERNSDDDGTATLDNAMDDNEDSEFEIHINSVEDEGQELEDDSEEDEDGDDDPCLSEPDLPECNNDEEEEPPTIM